MNDKSLFSHWKPQDILKVWLLAPFFLLAMIVSIVNVQANLMATYEPIFLQNPYKAWFLASLAIIGAVAIKQIPSSFKHEYNKRHYKRGLYILTALALLTWMVSFAYVFNGIGTSEEAEKASDAAAKFYMFIHVLSEVLATASLFMSLNDIFDEYFPKAQFRNPAYAPQLSNVNDLKNEKSEAEKRYLAILTKVSQHKTNRQAFIKEQEQAFALAVMRHDNLYND